MATEHTLGVLAFVAVLLAQPVQGDSFKIDISTEELDKRSGKIRVSHLAVKDSAHIRPTELCLSDNSLHLPSTTEPSDLTGTYAITLTVTMLPEKQLEAKVAYPTKPGEFDLSDIDQLLRALAEPAGFIDDNWSCEELRRVSKSPVEFYPVVSIDGHTNLSSLARDLDSRNLPFNKSD